MKKLLAMLLSLIMILTITACSGNESSDNESNVSSNEEQNITSEESQESNTSEDSTDTPTKTTLIPTTWYEVQIQSGDATLTASIILSNLDNKAAVKEADTLSHTKAEFTCDGNIVSINITDDSSSELHSYTFEKSGDTLIYKADSSDTLYYLGNSWDDTANLLEPVEDGTVFNGTTYDAYETAKYSDGSSTIEIDVDEMTIMFSNTDGLNKKGTLSFEHSGSISAELDDTFLSAYKMSDIELFFDLRLSSDYSNIASGYLTLVE